MHYTIDRNKQDVSPARFSEAHVQYVPAHDLGNGYTRHLIQLGEDDTADNPASTKGPIYGPAFVVYDCHRSGISVAVLENAGEFYDQLRPSKEDLTAAADIIEQHIDSEVLDGVNADDEGNQEAAADMRFLANRLRRWS